MLGDVGLDRFGLAKCGPLLQVHLDQLDQHQPAKDGRLGRQKVRQERLLLGLPGAQKVLQPPGQVFPGLRGSFGIEVEGHGE